MVQEVKNRIPSIGLGATNNDYNALLSIIRSFLGLYVMTCQPVQVVSSSNGFVNLKPVLTKTNTTGQTIPITDNDIIYNVPLLKFSANGWKINFKANVGDLGLLICSKYDISNYKKNHATSQVGSARVFSLSDGFYLPLDWNVVDDEGFVISKDNTSLTLTTSGVKIKGGTVDIEAMTANVNATNINLGGSGGKAVALDGDDVMSGGSVIGQVKASSITTKAV